MLLEAFQTQDSVDAFHAEEVTLSENTNAVSQWVGHELLVNYGTQFIRNRDRWFERLIQRKGLQFDTV